MIVLHKALINVEANRTFLAISLSLTTMVNAACYGTGAYLSCSDDSGNSYSVNRYGNTTQLNGYNAQNGTTWSQQSQTYGGMTQHSGTASDGSNWNSTQQTYGGITTYSGTDSNGNSFFTTCTAYGCN